MGHKAFFREEFLDKLVAAFGHEVLHPKNLLPRTRVFKIERETDHYNAPGFFQLAVLNELEVFAQMVNAVLNSGLSPELYLSSFSFDATDPIFTAELTRPYYRVYREAFAHHWRDFIDLTMGQDLVLLDFGLGRYLKIEGLFEGRNDRYELRMGWLPD